MKTMSQAGRMWLAHLEGAKSMAYPDTAGILTIGAGHVLSEDELLTGTILIGGVPVQWRYGLSQDQIATLLAQQMPPYENAVNGCITASLAQEQFEALVSFTYNEGVHALPGSSLAHVINLGQFDQVERCLLMWVYDHDPQTHALVKVQGLVNRREAEYAHWKSAATSMVTP